MRERYVTDPEGMQWVVGRKFLLGPPRYRGFRFGMGGADPEFEPPVTGGGTDELPRVARSRPAPDHPVRRDPPVRYRDIDSHWHRRRRGPGFVFLPSGWGGSSGGSGGGGGIGGGTRGGVGGGTRGGSGGGERGGAGAALAGAGGIGAVLIKALWWVLIVIAVAAALFLTIFVVLPTLLLLLQFLLIGVLIGWRAMTGRPWVVEARQNRAAPLVHAWEVDGWKASGRVRDEVAEALRRGAEPRPAGAEPVAVEGA